MIKKDICFKQFLIETLYILSSSHSIDLYYINSA